MPLTDVTPLEAEIEIDAPPARVWELVSDLRRMPRWSEQTMKVFARGEMGQGTTMVNLNRKGWRVWPTQSKVVDWVPEQRVAFRVKENWTVWSFDLSPTPGGGTRVVHRREAPQGISDLSVRLTKVALGGVDSFTSSLQRGMHQTLARVKTAAES